MSTTPFVWLTVHGQAHVERIGMPPDMADAGPRALVLGENDGGLLRWGSPSAARPGAYPLGPVALEEGKEPVEHGDTCSSPFGMRLVVGNLFGSNRGPHYEESSGRADALGFAISSVEESDACFQDPAFTDDLLPNANAHRLHLWLRDGLAWTNPIHPPGVPPLASNAFPNLDRFDGTQLGALVCARLEGATPATAFGVLLLDHGPNGPSAHHILATEQRAAQDLHVVHHWAHAIGATPAYHPLLVRV
jgi:hypothetical protein